MPKRTTRKNTNMTIYATIGLAMSKELKLIEESNKILIKQYSEFKQKFFDYAHRVDDIKDDTDSRVDDIMSLFENSIESKSYKLEPTDESYKLTEPMFKVLLCMYYQMDINPNILSDLTYQERFILDHFMVKCLELYDTNPFFLYVADTKNGKPQLSFPILIQEAIPIAGTRIGGFYKKKSYKFKNRRNRRKSKKL